MEELLNQRRPTRSSNQRKPKMELMELPHSKPVELVPWYLCSKCSRAFTDMDKMFDHKYTEHPEFAKLLEPRQRQKPKSKSKPTNQSTDGKTPQSTSGIGTGKRTRKSSATQDTVGNSALPRSKPCPKSKKPKTMSSSLDEVPKNEPRKKPKVDSAATAASSSSNALSSSVMQNEEVKQPENAFGKLFLASVQQKLNETKKNDIKALLAANKAIGVQEQTSEVSANKLKCPHCHKLLDTKDLLAQHVRLVHQFFVTKEGPNTLSESLMKPCELCGRNLAPPFKCVGCPNEKIILHHPKIKQEPVEPELTREENAENVDTDKPFSSKRRLRSSSLPDHSPSKIRKLETSEAVTNISVPSDTQQAQPKTPEKHVLNSFMVPQNEEQSKSEKPRRLSRTIIFGSPRPPRAASLNRRSLIAAPVTVADAKKSPPNLACRVCSKNFKSESNLLTHERAHKINNSPLSFASTPIVLD